ncbi:MAG: cobalamin-binding protein [Gammaproteobacteria bacterium]|nr:cobalamin-binding protein [Gammaproteobacteria bacterium]
MPARWIGLALVLLASGAHARIRVTDDRGTEVVLARPAQRIVSLAPDVTQLLFAAGAGSHVVGVSAFSDHPRAARALPRIGDSRHLDLELILSLHPDLVVGWASGNSPQDIARLRQLGLPVFMTEPARLAQIPGLIEKLGRMAGTETQARHSAAAFRAGLRALRSEYGGGRRLTVFFQIWSEPLMTLTRRQMVNDVLDLCGGKNVFARLSGIAPQIGREDVVRADPDVIIISEPRSIAAADLKRWRRVRVLRAVREHHLYVVRPGLIMQPGPRVLEGARAVCADLASARGRRVR